MIRKFLKDAVFVSGMEGILKLKALIILPLLTHYFGAVNYGVWSQVTILIAIVGPFIIFSTDSGFARYAPGQSVQVQKGYFSAWLLFLFGNATFMCAVLILLRHDIAGSFFGESEEYVRYIVLVAISLFLAAFLGAVRKWFLLQNRPRMCVGVSLLEAVTSISAVTATLVLEQGVFELVTYTLIGDLSIIIVTYTVIALGYGFAKPDFSIVKPALRFGLPLVPAGFAVWGLNYIDRLFLLHYGSMSDVGIYAFTYSLGYIIISLFARPFRMMYPSLATAFHNQRKAIEHQRIFNYSAGMVLGLTIPATIGLWVLRDPLVAILAPPEFSAGAPMIAIISLGYIFTVMASYYEIHLGLAFRQHWYTISIAIAFVANIGLNFLLIPKYLILGAAIATTVSFLIQFLVSFAISRRESLVRNHWMFFIKVIAASVAMGQIVTLVRNAVFPAAVNAYVELLSMSLLGAVVYGAIVLLIGIVPRDHVAYLLRRHRIDGV